MNKSELIEIAKSAALIEAYVNLTPQRGYYFIIGHAEFLTTLAFFDENEYFNAELDPADNVLYVGEPSAPVRQEF